MINSLVPQTIARSMAQATSQENNQRKIDSEKLLDFYVGHQIEDLKADLIQYSGNSEQLKPVCINLVKKITNRLSQVYTKPATRTIDGTDKDQEVFTEIETASKLNIKLKQASRYAKLLKSIFIKVTYRSGQVQLDILTPDIMDVETGNSPEDLQAVTVTHYPASGKTQEVEYHRWTADIFQILDYRGRVKSTEPNIYKTIPFIPLHDSLPIDQFFQPLPLDLISLQEAINIKLTDLLHTISLQSHGQPVSKGLPERSSLKVGPNNAISLPADTRDKKHDFKFADTNAKILEVVEAIQALINWAYISHGLPASSITSDVKEASGKAKQVDNFELDEMRADDIELFRIFEQQIFTLIKIVHNHHADKKLSESCTISVDFPEPKQPTSEKEQIENWQALMDMGLMSIIQVAMRKNPDLTREDAEAQILQVQEDNKILEGKTL